MIKHTITKCPICDRTTPIETDSFITFCIIQHVIIYKNFPRIMINDFSHFPYISIEAYKSANAIDNDVKFSAFLVLKDNIFLIEEDTKSIDNNKIKELFHILKATRVFE